jgi:hypothetical protein
MKETCIDLIELKPYNTINSLWISKIFQHDIRRFDGRLQSNTLPVFIVQGSTEYGGGNRSIEYELFSYLNESGYSFGLIHVMDEIYDHDISIYGLEKCALIFREYFRPTGGRTQFLADFGKSFFIPNRYSSCHRQYSGSKLLAYELYLRSTHIFRKFDFMKRQYLPRLPADKLFCIPLGYTDKFARSRKPYSFPFAQRRYKWSFAGNSFKTDRKQMLGYLADVKPNYIYEYQGFMGELSLSGEEYWDILTQSMFVPCSLGNLNIDTYRLFEVLEAGSIPIILKSHAWQPYDYYQNLLGDHPLPAFSSWKEARLFLINADLNLIMELSEKVIEWYAEFKLKLQRRIQECLLDAARERLLPHDVEYLDSLCF